ncbi:MAG: hypothetical protein OXH93_22545 [Caldilineaceae bacterium]|nr:hypothetical protein [Caldilineaceae bacterium]
MRNHTFHIRMIAVLVAAAVFLSGCHHMMSRHTWKSSLSRMDRMVHPDGMDRTDLQDKMDRMVRPDRSSAKRGWRVSKADRPGYTVAMVEKALRLYDAKGREATLEYYNSPESVDGQWYVFIFDENDELVAHPNPDALGESLYGPMGVDVAGYRHGEVIATATEDGFWVDYIFLNPVSGNQEYKHTWAVRHDGLIFASGWYQVLPTLGLGVSKAEPAEYTVAFVDRALRYYKAHGREATVAHYNTPESVDGAWYIYVFDENDLLIAHANPDLLGMDLKEELGLDSTGYHFGTDMLEATEEGLWIHYVFVNPATGEEETKHAWAVRHDGLLIGSGWYE